MNVIIKTEDELQLMRKAGKILSDTLKLVEQYVKVGETTAQLNKVAHEYILSCGATPTFLGYEGFKYSICASVNDEIVHGFPNDNPLREGDIVGIDIGVNFQGWNADAARTFGVGKISEENQRLIDVTKQCFFEGISDLTAGCKLGNISNRIQIYAEKNGYSVVREMVGHGVGHDLHEDPMVPNYGSFSGGITLKENMTLAIEPMINMGTRRVGLHPNGWTILTIDGKNSAHYENTVIIKNDGVEIITL